MANQIATDSPRKSRLSRKSRVSDSSQPATAPETNKFRLTARHATVHHLDFWRRNSDYIEPTDRKIHLNVSGVKFTTLVSTLTSRPGTLLANLGHRHMEDPKDEYFFDRHHRSFICIMDYYRSGELHIPFEVCPTVFKRELQFWRLDYRVIEPCCWIRFSSSFDSQLEHDVDAICPSDIILVEGQQSSRFLRYRHKLWFTLNYPLTSKAAMAYLLVMILLVLANLLLQAIQSLPEMFVPSTIMFNKTTCTRKPDSPEYFTDTTPNGFYAYLYDAFAVCFSVDWIARVASAPSFRAIVFSIVTYIDLFALMPAYVRIIMRYEGCMIYEKPRVQEAIYFLSIFRVIKIILLMKYFKPMAVLMRSMRNSIYELVTLLLFVTTAILVFGFMVYFCEKYSSKDGKLRDNNDFIANIPLGLWFSLCTLTSVGYGDLLPYTWLGCVFAGICAVLGCILLSLTIPAISSNFTTLYTHVMSRDLALQRRQQHLHDHDDDDDDDHVDADAPSDDRVISRAFQRKRTESRFEIDEVASSLSIASLPTSTHVTVSKT